MALQGAEKDAARERADATQPWSPPPGRTQVIGFRDGHLGTVAVRLLRTGNGDDSVEATLAAPHVFRDNYCGPRTPVDLPNGLD